MVIAALLEDIHDEDVEAPSHCTIGTLCTYQEARWAMHCAKNFERACRDMLVHIQHCNLNELPKNIVGRQLLDVRRPSDGKLCIENSLSKYKYRLHCKDCIYRNKAHVKLQLVMLGLCCMNTLPVSNPWLQ